VTFAMLVYVCNAVSQASRCYSDFDPEDVKINAYLTCQICRSFSVFLQYIAHMTFSSQAFVHSPPSESRVFCGCTLKDLGIPMIFFCTCIKEVNHLFITWETKKALENLGHASMSTGPDWPAYIPVRTKTPHGV
jgi:hypothetical protein